MSCITSVLYKLPHSKHFTRITSQSNPIVLKSLLQVPLSGGYIIMPFTISSESPLLFIQPDKVEVCPLVLPSTKRTQHAQMHTNEAAERANYTQAFNKVKHKLNGHLLQKVVLSRRLNIEQLQGNDAEQLFLRACHYRPNSFVALWNTPQTGQWLVATPEPLLEMHHHQCSTVALAGTLPWVEGEAPHWNHKNKEEQAIVARYIKQQLANVATNIHTSATYTLHTGNIQHLCTDFTFNLYNASDLPAVLQQLHPTPAVCGLPCDEAKAAIKEAEHSPRLYYAGFSGPIHLYNETHLFVSLRCMHFTSHSATLYAGGGIMPESLEKEEWEETQRKMETIKSIL